MHIDDAVLDRPFHRRRASEEATRATLADCDAAMHAHAELARLHIGLCALGGRTDMCGTCAMQVYCL